MSFPIESFIVVGCLRMGSSVCLFLCVCVCYSKWFSSVCYNTKTPTEWSLTICWPLFSCYYLFIDWYINPLRIDRDSQGFIYLHLYVCMCVSVCLKWFSHSTEYTNMTFHWIMVDIFPYLNHDSRFADVIWRKLLLLGGCSRENNRSWDFYAF